MTAPELDIHRALAVTERLKLAVVEFAKREDRLIRGLDARRSGIAWRYQSATSGDEESLATQLTETQAWYEAAEARVRTVAKNREARVRRASTLALRTLPHRGREARGNFLANLQMRQMNAGNTRATKLQAADAEHGHAAAALTDQCRLLIHLKREARKSFTGYGSFRKRLAQTGAIEAPGGEEGMRQVAGALAEAEAQLSAFKQYLLPRIFQFVPPPIAGLICVLVGAGVAAGWHFNSTGYTVGGGVAAVLLAAVFGIFLASKRHVERSAVALAEAVVKADGLYEAVRGHGSHAHAVARQAIQDEYDKTMADIAEQWSRAPEIETEFQTRTRARVESKAPSLLAKIRDQEVRKAAELAAACQARLVQLRDNSGARRDEATRQHAAEESQWTHEEIEEWKTIETQWKAEIEPIYAEIHAMQAEGQARFPDWDEKWIDAWTPPREFPTGAKFGNLEVNAKNLAGTLPKDPRLALPGPADFSLPLALTFPDQGSLLFEAKESGQAAVNAALNALILRLLVVSPPGKISFTIIDPVGLGQNFAGLMFLADYEESLINRRIWTQQSQIEERLAELNEHIEKVIQMYLRNEYATISQYNEKAGSVAEKYHFLVIADFPAQFSETAARRLQSIATSGPRCGVFTFIQWDQRQTAARGAGGRTNCAASSICIQRRGDGYFLPGVQPEAGTKLALDAPPDPDLSAKLIHKTGQASVDSNRVEVPFSQISPARDEMWTNDTTQELKVAIGRTGATKPQYLAIGKGTRQHALFAGKTGSGKSTLFHVIITNLALSCRPAARSSSTSSTSRRASNSNATPRSGCRTRASSPSRATANSP